MAGLVAGGYMGWLVLHPTSLSPAFNFTRFVHALLYTKIAPGLTWSGYGRPLGLDWWLLAWLLPGALDPGPFLELQLRPSAFFYHLYLAIRFVYGHQKWSVWEQTLPSLNCMLTFLI